MAWLNEWARVSCLAAATLLCACRGVSAPSTVAGVYALRSTSGTIGALETPLRGTLTLTPEGVAARRIVYRADTAREFLDIGTYGVMDSRVELALRANGGQSPYVWRVAATLAGGGTLRLTYPRAADGTIEEVYQRE